MAKTKKAGSSAKSGKQPGGKKTQTDATMELTAKQFIDKLRTFQSAAELKKYERFFKFTEANPIKGDRFIGVRMGDVFKLGRQFMEMPVAEIEKLMESDIHEIRAGAMSIMGQHAKSNKITDERLKALYDLYTRRHDRINSWDLVDLASYYVVGRYLADKPRKILYTMARSKNQWERRTAILSTAHFIMKLRETEDTFKLAALLINDKEDFVQKAVGWMLRTAGGVDRPALSKFLDKHAATMPRQVLRAALEHYDKKQKERYLTMK
jgi:hypothetical protein